nr:hypothetical protein GCM10020093_100270 [Planobispora longispora]
MAGGLHGDGQAVGGGEAERGGDVLGAGGAHDHRGTVPDGEVEPGRLLLEAVLARGEDGPRTSLRRISRSVPAMPEAG